MIREKNVPRPRAIQPCLDIGTLLLDVHTAVAQTMVTISIATKTPSRMNWPPLSEPPFVGFGGGKFCTIALNLD